MVKDALVFSDSRKVTPGSTFVAIKGLSHDGHDFIPQAIRAGAKTIIGEIEKPKDFPKDRSYLRVTDSRKALGEELSKSYGYPSKKLTVIGVTGTDGKTTTASLIYHILSKNGRKVGLISTVSAKVGNIEFDTGLHVTNPEPELLQKLLAQMVEAGCEYAVIEVTSHGIDQQRIAGIKFDLTVLTNITPEHLDYHKTFTCYRQTKLSFLKLADKVVLNAEEKNYSYLVSKLKDKRIIPYSRTKDVEKILPGIYNESNAAAAIAVCEALGFNKQAAISAIATFLLPQGRLEEIKNNLGIKIYVDFAHTPNALEAVLTSLKSETKNKLIVVFGCAGERDPRKRSKMGKISTTIADFSIFTAEDPRSEKLGNILSKMAFGAKKAKAKEGINFVRIPLRSEAICYALKVAKSGDTVVICGKGHEKSMCYGKYEHFWNDKEFIKNYLNSYTNLAGVILAAGKGSRMKSLIPKVLHTICGRPMIAYAMENLRKAGIVHLVPVVGFKRNLVLSFLSRNIDYAIQKKTLGTGDALNCGLGKIRGDVFDILAINGDDSAFYKTETIRDVINTHRETNSTITFVSLNMADPTGLGRVVRGKGGNLVSIVEEKDANDDQKKITEVNDGLYIFNYAWLTKNIKAINKNNASGEYYIVDLVKIALSQQAKVTVFKLKDSSEWQGVNTQEQLANAEAKMREKILSIN